MLKMYTKMLKNSIGKKADFLLISNSLMPALKTVLKTLEGKNYANLDFRGSAPF
jgi:hypothetical protein